MIRWLTLLLFQMSVLMGVVGWDGTCDRWNRKCAMYDKGTRATDGIFCLGYHPEGILCSSPRNRQCAEDTVLCPVSGFDALFYETPNAKVRETNGVAFSFENVHNMECPYDPNGANSTCLALCAQMCFSDLLCKGFNYKPHKRCYFRSSVNTTFSHSKSWWELDELYFYEPEEKRDWFTLHFRVLFGIFLSTFIFTGGLTILGFQCCAYFRRKGDGNRRDPLLLTPRTPERRI